MKKRQRHTTGFLKTCALSVAALAAAGCSRQPTTLYVRLRSDFAEGQVRSIRADVQWNRVMDGGIGQQDGGAPEFALTNAAGEVVRRFPGTIVVAPAVLYDNTPVDVTLRVLPTAGEGAAFDVKARVRFARERASVLDMFVPALCSDPAVRDRCVRRTLTEGVEYTCAGEGDDPCIPLREQTASEYRPDAGPAPVDVRVLDVASADAGVFTGHPFPAVPPPSAVYSGVPTRFRVRIERDCGGADEVRVRFCQSFNGANNDCPAADPLASVVGSVALASCDPTSLEVAAPLVLSGPRTVWWRAEYVRAGVLVGQRSAWRSFTVRRIGPALPALLGMRADLDDDGVVDLVASAPGEGRFYYALGSTIRGAAAGITMSPWPAVEAGNISANAIPTPTTMYFARAIAFAGNAEANDDNDVLVGDPAANSGRGWVHRFRWSGSGPRFNSTDALIGSPTDVSFGQAIATGDFDDDGFPDVVVGAPGNASGAGAVFVYRGNSLGYTSGGAPRDTIAGVEGGARTGSSLAAGCDIDGDGTADAVVGSPGASMGSGLVHLFFGQRGTGLQIASPMQIAAADGSLDGFGTTVACDGDYNADGYADIAVATAGITNRGTIYVFAGGPSTRTIRPMIIDRIAGLGPGDRPGQSLSFARFTEVEADGDVLVAGEPETAMSEAGYLKLLARSFAATPVFFLAESNIPNSRFGASVQVLGDLDGDGRDELAVGQPLFASGFGQVAVLHFNMLSMTGRAPQRIAAPAAAAPLGQFGASMIR